MSKDKGSRYEREFVRLVQDAGLPAERMPLSGALGGKYRDDVLVCDTWRVECKYRKDGTGFSRLHEWLGAADELVLPHSGLVVYHIGFWLGLVRSRIDGTEPPGAFVAEKGVTRQAAMLNWMGNADFLALRRANHAWLIAERLP